MKKTMMLLMALSAVVMGTAAADLRDGLEGYWPLDGNYSDTTGHGHDGTASGGLTFVQGVTGQAVDCPGSGGINTGSWNPSETTGRLSVSCWAKWRPGATDSWQGLVAKRTEWAAGQTYWFIECSTVNDSLYFQSYSGGWIGYNGWEAVAGTWHHVALSYDGATARLYVDNVEVASGGFTFGQDSDADITIGMVQANGGGAFNGLIDEVAIWNRAISPAEVAELYNNGSGMSLAGNPWQPVPTSPPNNAVDIPMEGTLLQWDPPTEAPPSPIIRYDVYLHTDRGEVADPNLVSSPAFLASVDPAGPLQAATGELLNDMTYYWKVVAYIDDANSASSPVMRFDAVSRIPTIVTQPQDVGVGPGGWDASFTIAATSPADGPTYAWYKEGSTGVLGTDPTYTVYGVDDTKTGGYYCVVSNSFGHTRSRTARLSILRYEPGGGLRQNLVAYYPLDGNTLDASGNGRDGIMNGPAGYVEGVVGQGVQFDGASYINLGTWNPSEATGNLAISVWASWDGGGDVWHGIIGKSNSWGANNMMWILEGTTDTTWVDYGDVEFKREGAWAPLRFNMPDDSTVKHIVVSCDNTNVTMYVDGEGVGSGTLPFGNKTDAGLQIGATNKGGGNKWSGLIDEVCLWDRPLTQAEVQQLYAGGSGISLPGPAWWQPVNPIPDGSTPVDPTVDLALTWEYGPYVPLTADYKVYFGVGDAAKDILSDPNSDASAYYMGAVTTGSPLEFVILAARMDYNQTCWWRVDTADSGYTVPGLPWSFDTVLTLPIITAQPAGVLVDPGGSAQVSIGVSSQIPETYEWFKVGGASVGTGNPITIENIDESKEGDYYCVVTNAAGPVTSASAKVMLKQLVAHWTMDDIIGGGNMQVLDATQFAHHGTATAGVTSIPGKIGGALSFNNGRVDCGTFNPSDPGGQLTIAFWANWAGSTGTWQSVMGKRDTWGDGNMMWQVTCHAQNNNWLRIDNPVSYPWFGGDDFLAIGDWTHVAITFDGTNVTMYFDGFLAGGPTPFQFSRGPKAHIYLGGADAAGDTYNGAIDDVRIYNYALDPISAVKLYADVTGMPGCPYTLTYDVSHDCAVNLVDVAMIASDWMECGLIPETACE